MDAASRGVWCWITFCSASLVSHEVTTAIRNSPVYHFLERSEGVAGARSWCVTLCTEVFFFLVVVVYAEQHLRNCRLAPVQRRL